MVEQLDPKKTQEAADRAAKKTKQIGFSKLNELKGENVSNNDDETKRKIGFVQPGDVFNEPIKANVNISQIKSVHQEKEYASDSSLGEIIPGKEDLKPTQENYPSDSNLGEVIPMAPAQNESQPLRQENQEARQEGQENAGEQPRQEQAAERDQRLEELENSLKDAREMFARTDYRDRTVMERIKKALNLRPKEGEQENPNITSVRTSYERALNELKDYRLEKIRQGANSGQETENQLKELITFFNFNEGLNFYDARQQAKMEYLDEKDGKGFFKRSFDKVRSTSMNVADWYNKKVPTYVKIGLGLTSFAPGLTAIKLGKRGWGAFMIMAAGGMQIDKIAQLKDNIGNKIESNRIIKGAKDGEQIDFDHINSILDEKISGIDQKLSQHVMRSHINKFIAFGSAIFLGASTVMGALDLAHADAGKESGSIIQKVLSRNAGKENFGSYEKFKDMYSYRGEIPAGSDEIPIDITKDGSVNGGDFDSLSKGGPLGGPADQLLRPSGTGAEILGGREVIGVHKSVEHTLIDYLKAKHPEIKNPGNYAHKMVLGFMKEKGIEEPNLVYESNNLELESDGKGGIKLKEIQGKFGHRDIIPKVEKVIEIDTDSDEVSAGSEKAPMDEYIKNAVDEALEKRKAEELLQQQADIKVAQENYADANHDYSSATTEAQEARGEVSADQMDKMGEADNRSKLWEDYLKEKMDYQGKFAQEVKVVGKDFAAQTGYSPREFETMKMDEAFADEKTRPVLDKYFDKYKKEFRGTSVIMQKQNETVKQWIIRMAANSVKKKIGLKVE